MCAGVVRPPWLLNEGAAGDACQASRRLPPRKTLRRNAVLDADQPGGLHP